ncbi:MAG TPA: PD-(D/E)XK nuclease family protein [Verrucomicrobiae bacterium]|nr:PD-(D/E)XK nuclease family protein [Verrucomicrobiae bacterium]
MITKSNPAFKDAEHLLDFTKTLLSYETRLVEATGEKFNIFEILRIGTYEVATHSPIIAELLNPQGRHGMGNCFLKIFINQFADHVHFDLGTNAVVRKEMGIGAKTDEKGGRIDIFVSDRKNTLIIENKIYAAEQEKQISRYLKSYPNAVVFYLTLNGDSPCEEITEKDKGRLLCISYKFEILRWLEACHKEVARSPLVRETISQYINLIKILTDQNTNVFMQDQLTDTILKNKDTLAAYLKLVRSRDDVAEKILLTLKRQCEEISVEFKLKLDFVFKGAGEKSNGFYFYDDVMKEKNLQIGFEFDASNLRSFAFGIAHFQPTKDFDNKKIVENFGRIFGRGQFNKAWPIWQYWENRQNWWSENDTSFEDVRSGTLKVELREKVGKLLSIIRN